jgi:Helix-turn-helix domain
MSDQNAPLTLSVPEAGRRYFNLSRNAAYAAAERGEIPTVKIGRLLRVPVRALERMLDGAALSGRWRDDRAN